MNKKLIPFLMVLCIFCLSSYPLKSSSTISKDQSELESNIKNKSLFDKQTRTFLNPYSLEKLNQTDILTWEKFLNENQNDSNLESEIFYTYPFLQVQKIYLLTNLPDKDKLCSVLDSLFTYIGNEQNKGGSISIDMSINPRNGIFIYQAGTICSEYKNKDYLNEISRLSKSNIIKTSNKYIIYYYDNAKNNVKWLAEFFELDFNSINLGNNEEDAIRILVFDSEFKPIHYKQFKSNSIENSLERYKSNTFYEKDGHLYWTHNNEIAL